MTSKTILLSLVAMLAAGGVLVACEDENPATVQIKNGFDKMPPWTICESSFRGEQFGKIEIGKTSQSKEVTPGKEHVLMVAAWNDPSCATEHCLPIATKNKEEVVAGNKRVIEVSKENHQGPCPPEGIAPIPEDLYNEIRKLWPKYNFKEYADRKQNPQCMPKQPQDKPDAGVKDASSEAEADASTALDATSDARTDASSTPDASMDAELDAAPDVKKP